MKNIVIFIFMFFALAKLSAQNGYSIKGNIVGVKDTSVFLGYHYADKQYLKDTAKVDSKGNFEFKGKKKLDGGIYLVVTPEKKYFEIIIADDQEFSFENNVADLILNMKVKGSTENELFYQYLTQVNKYGKDIETLRQRITNDEKEKEEINKQIGQKEIEIDQFRNEFAEKNKGTFVAKMFKAMQDVKIPDSPKDDNGNVIDSLFGFKYYRQHFWDTYDFSDDKLLRSPIYHSKLKMYLDKLTYQIPDSINVAADFLATKARANKEVFKYTVWYVTTTYEQSKLMGFDRVFVHMVDNYYAKGDAFWVDSTQLAKIVKRANDIRPTLLGNKAHNLVMYDTLNKIQQLHSVNAHTTLLYFWDPDCGHCKKETPEVLRVWQPYKDKVKVFAVCTKRDLEAWKKFIKEKGLKDWINVYDPTGQSRFHEHYDIYSTPVLYILDKDKKIIAKRIDHEGLEQYLKRTFENK
jgi:thiol-disulfide isomerase/thioredoxin